MEYYLASDYAAAAITNIDQRLRAEPEKWAHVAAHVAAADDFSAIGDTFFDLVLINSVAQYFPGADYLLSVIKKAAQALNRGGCIFIGDMQGKNSLEMYHAMDYLPRTAENISIAEFRDVIANRVRIDDELVADPTFFYLLRNTVPQITGIVTQLRKGQSQNETTKYHYDVWLYVSQPVEVARIQLHQDWEEVQTVARLRQLLTANVGKVIEIKNVPNARTTSDKKLLHLLSSADAQSPVSSLKDELVHIPIGIHPDEFWAIGEKHRYRTYIRWTTDGTDGLFDAVFIPASSSAIPPGPASTMSGDMAGYIQNPYEKNELPVADSQLRRWKEGLSTVLPAYMVPDDFVALKNFPLTPNAKIDRKALPKPARRFDPGVSSARSFTKNEQIVKDIWSETLGLPDLTVQDDFFRLGGHSLLAVKVMVALEKQTGKRLPIGALFNHPTIEKLASLLANDTAAKQWDALVPIQTEGKKNPVFLVHGGGLNIMLFQHIREFFDADQPLYGIQALGLNHPTDIPPTIEQIAGRYIIDILKVHPNGPYSLAGYSLGGFLAFEMAKQLRQMGKTISFLGIMDTNAGNNDFHDNKVAGAVRKVTRQFSKALFFSKSFITNPGESLEYQKFITRRKLQKMQSPDELYISEYTFTDYEAGIYRIYSDALDVYALSPANVRVCLFRAQKRLYFLDDGEYLGWRKFALDGVDIIEVPGDHKSFLYPPYSRHFASALQNTLNGIQ